MWLALRLCGSVVDARAGYEEGLAAFKQGNYATAFQELLPLAEQGDAKSQYLLGRLYHDGKGVPQGYSISAPANLRLGNVRSWLKADIARS